jgi:hypothetical protein
VGILLLVCDCFSAKWLAHHITPAMTKTRSDLVADKHRQPRHIHSNPPRLHRTRTHDALRHYVNFT